MIRRLLAALRGAPERRSAGYAQQILAAAESAAAGTGGAVAAATAAVETCAGLWARSLALADVQPSRARAVLTPSVLALIGRSLARSGEIVFDLEVSAGRLTLLPASSAYITVGSGDRATWVYTITVDGPADTRTVYRRRDAVAHVQYAYDPTRPWLGRAPWASARLSGALLAGIERQLSGEAGGPSGYVLSTPDVGDQSQDAPDAGDGDADDAPDPLAQLRADLSGAGGKTTLAPAMAGGWGGGPGVAPQNEYHTTRYGFDPPEHVNVTREAVERSIVGTFGVPPVLFHGTGAAAGMREAWRIFQTLGVEPLARIVAEQLSGPLGVDVVLDMRRTRAADTTMLARAVSSLVSAGMSVADAREVVGL